MRRVGGPIHSSIFNIVAAPETPQRVFEKARISRTKRLIHRDSDGLDPSQRVASMKMPRSEMLRGTKELGTDSRDSHRRIDPTRVPTAAAAVRRTASLVVTMRLQARSTASAAALARYCVGFP
jgi:hypothetical protein